MCEALAIRSPVMEEKDVGTHVTFACARRSDCLRPPKWPDSIAEGWFDLGRRCSLYQEIFMYQVRSATLKKDGGISLRTYCIERVRNDSIGIAIRQ